MNNKSTAKSKVQKKSFLGWISSLSMLPLMIRTGIYAAAIYILMPKLTMPLWASFLVLEVAVAIFRAVAIKVYSLISKNKKGEENIPDEPIIPPVTPVIPPIIDSPSVRVRRLTEASGKTQSPAEALLTELREKIDAVNSLSEYMSHKDYDPRVAFFVAIESQDYVALKQIISNPEVTGKALLTKKYNLIEYAFHKLKDNIMNDVSERDISASLRVIKELILNHRVNQAVLISELWKAVPNRIFDTWATSSEKASKQSFVDMICDITGVNDYSLYYKGDHLTQPFIRYNALSFRKRLIMLESLQLPKDADVRFESSDTESAMSNSLQTKCDRQFIAVKNDYKEEFERLGGIEAIRPLIHNALLNEIYNEASVDRNDLNSTYEERNRAQQIVAFINQNRQALYLGRTAYNTEVFEEADKLFVSNKVSTHPAWRFISGICPGGGFTNLYNYEFDKKFQERACYYYLVARDVEKSGPNGVAHYFTQMSAIVREKVTNWDGSQNDVDQDIVPCEPGHFTRLAQTISEAYPLKSTMDELLSDALYHLYIREIYNPLRQRFDLNEAQKLERVEEDMEFFGHLAFHPDPLVRAEQKRILFASSQNETVNRFNESAYNIKRDSLLERFQINDWNLRRASGFDLPSYIPDDEISALKIGFGGLDFLVKLKDRVNTDFAATRAAQDAQEAAKLCATPVVVMPAHASALEKMKKKLGIIAKTKDWLIGLLEQAKVLTLNAVNNSDELLDLLDDFVQEFAYILRDNSIDEQDPLPMRQLKTQAAAIVVDANGDFDVDSSTSLFFKVCDQVLTKAPAREDFDENDLQGFETARNVFEQKRALIEKVRPN